jgi:protoheme ferro-lyase
LWVGPNESIPNDTSYFLYYEGTQGMPTVAAKTAAKARYLYYAPLRDGYLPHGDQTRALARDAIALLRAHHPQIVATGIAGVFDAAEKEAAVRHVLDAGADVLVLGSGQPIYSDFEELRGSYSEIYKIVAAWRAENGNKPVRIVAAPWMATEAGYDALWLDHFAATVPPVTAPGQAALGIISLHGLPVSLAGKDSWSKRWPVVAERLKPRMAAIMKAKGYATTRVGVGSEAFADDVEDTRNQLVSVNELYREARQKKYALAIALPIEFLAENTDTLFAHQALFFNGLAGYRTYAPPPRDTDWTRPYVRTLRDGATTIIYAGAPGGAVQPRASIVLADAIGRVFPRSTARTAR